MGSVAVIGAGMAGLAAALRLEEAGHHVTVLEARDRVGGRVLSTLLPNGSVAELGGEWITAHQTAVADLAEQLGLKLIPTGLDFARRSLGSQPITDAEHTRVLSNIERAYAALSGDQRDTMSAQELLDSIDDGSAAIQLTRSRLEGSAAAPLGNVATSEVVGEFGIEQTTYFRVDGGNQGLAHQIATRLRHVHLESPVNAITAEEHHLSVTTSGPAIQADAVVVAVPPSTIEAISFEPDLPTDIRTALATIRMGSASKIAVEAENPPLFARQDDDDTWWCWTGEERDRSPRQVVSGFAGARASSHLSKDRWSDLIRRLIPDGAGETAFKDWTRDPLAGGCYSVLGPGHESVLAAFDAPDRIVFAGEHTTGSGSIDGAIASGWRASEAVSNYLASR